MPWLEWLPVHWNHSKHVSLSWPLFINRHTKYNARIMWFAESHSWKCKMQSKRFGTFPSHVTFLLFKHQMMTFHFSLTFLSFHSSSAFIFSWLFVLLHLPHNDLHIFAFIPIDCGWQSLEDVIFYFITFFLVSHFYYVNICAGKISMW